MTAAVLGAVAAGGAKVARTASGAMRTPIAHVSTDIGSLHLEGNITPWTCVIGVLMGSTAGVYYNYYRTYGKAVAQRALAHTIPRIMRGWEQGAQKLLLEYQKASPKEKPLVMQRMAAYGKAFTAYSRWAMTQLGYTGTYEGLVPGHVTAKANEVLAKPGPKYDPPNVAEAFGAGLGTIVMQVVNGMSGALGGSEAGKTYTDWQLAGSPLLWGLKAAKVI